MAGKTYKDTTTTSGKYSITVPKIESGKKITITQSNDTGLKSNNITPRVYDLTVSKIVYSGGKYIITGSCKKGETVSIKVSGKTYTDKTTTSGAYSISIPSQKATQEITITQGNEKQTVVRKINSKTMHLLKYYKPNVTAKKNSTYVTGNSICKGAEVSVTINGKTYVGKVDSKGQYKVKTSKLKKNTKVTVQIKSGSSATKKTSLTIK